MADFVANGPKNLFNNIAGPKYIVSLTDSSLIGFFKSRVHFLLGHFWPTELDTDRPSCELYLAFIITEDNQQLMTHWWVPFYENRRRWRIRDVRAICRESFECSCPRCRRTDPRIRPKPSRRQETSCSATSSGIKMKIL